MSLGLRSDIGPSILDMISLKVPMHIDGLSVFNPSHKEAEFSFQYRYHKRIAMVYKNLKYLYSHHLENYECYNIVKDYRETENLNDCNRRIPRNLLNIFENLK